MTNQELVIIVGLLTVVATIVTIKIKTKYDKQRITNYFLSQNFKIVKIESDSLANGIYQKYAHDLYKVIIKDAKGIIELRSCQTSIRTGVTEIIANNKHLCTHCSEIIEAYHTTCPRCNLKLDID